MHAKGAIWIKEQVCIATNEIVVACTMVQIVVFPREHHHLQVTKESYRSIFSLVFLLCGFAIQPT